jgi:NarL family two-component system response regulator LiaR
MRMDQPAKVGGSLADRSACHQGDQPHDAGRNPHLTSGRHTALEAVKAGAISYVLKTAGVEAVVESVRAAARRERVLDPSVAAKVLEEMRRPHGRDMVDQLSKREVEVLTALARGRSNKEIAQDLSIGEETVKTHVSNLLSKLHLADRTQAAIYGLQRRLVPLEDALEGPG